MIILTLEKGPLRKLFQNITFKELLKNYILILKNVVKKTMIDN